MGPSCLRKSSVPDSLGHGPNIRKYMVLLHDCVAVKFKVRRNRCSSSSTHLLGEDLGGLGGGGGSGNGNVPGKKSGGKKSEDAYRFPDYGLTNHYCHTPDGVEGITLFQTFREANLKCYWNAAIAETFQHLEYRGIILPSTIFVSAQRKFLLVLRQAWARQMLRTPPGFLIEFVGDTEEILCEPVQQSHFSPLSDSLCWTILDMTSRGEEAIIEKICAALGQAFPGMVVPSYELVYQTLEKLIRDRKVYHTSRGYFVVTPDTFRYITAAREAPTAFSTHSLTLDALLNSHYQQQDDGYSRHSWDSAASAELFTPPMNLSRKNAKSSNSSGLKRHNSLKLFRRKDNHSEMLGAKSLSFRLSKSKPFMFDVSMEEEALKASKSKSSATIASEPGKTEKGTSKKGKGLFSKLFSFGRSSSRSKRKQLAAEEEELKKAQTASSSELVPPRLEVDVSNLLGEDSESGCFTLDRENHYDFAGIPKWNSLPKRSCRSSSSRRSVFGMVDDANALYATPDSTASSSGEPPAGGSSSFTRTQSSRSSTLSQGTSLGYGSQGPNSFLTSQSPCNSSANSTYATLTNPANSMNSGEKGNKTGARGRDSLRKSYYDFYRRRYPSSRFYGSTRRSSSPMMSANGKPLYETIGNGKGNSDSGVESTPKSDGQDGGRNGNAMETKADLTTEKLEDKTAILSNKSTDLADAQVKTIVNSNGQIETHFDCRHGRMKSTIEIKASNNNGACEDCLCDNNNKNNSSNSSDNNKDQLLIEGNCSSTESKINLATRLFSHVNFATKLRRE